MVKIQNLDVFHFIIILNEYIYFRTSEIRINQYLYWKNSNGQNKMAVSSIILAPQVGDPSCPPQGILSSWILMKERFPAGTLYLIGMLISLALPSLEINRPIITDLRGSLEMPSE